MEIKELICTDCKQILLKYPYIGWGHKPYNTCALNDGLTYYEYDKDGLKFGVFLIEEIDIEPRKFFLKKFEMLENEQTLNSEKSGLNAVQIDNEIIINQPKAIKKKSIYDLFEVYESI